MFSSIVALGNEMELSCRYSAFVICHSVHVYVKLIFRSCMMKWVSLWIGGS